MGAQVETKPAKSKVCNEEEGYRTVEAQQQQRQQQPIVQSARRGAQRDLRFWTTTTDELRQPGCERDNLRNTEHCITRAVVDN